MTDRNLPAKRGSGKKSNDVLERIRNATPAKQTDSSAIADRAALHAAALKPRRPRLVFAMDATASRQGAWDEAKKATDTLFTALPGELDIALAVHSGSTVKVFTDFSNDVATFRDHAASVSCVAGMTRLVDIMGKTRSHSDVRVFLYIGDCFEESERDAYAAADAFRARGIRAIMMHDSKGGGGPNDRQVFEEIARRTGGVCIDFHGGDRQGLKDIFEAVAVLAAGGIKALEQRKGQLPGAAKLLPYLK